MNLIEVKTQSDVELYVYYVLRNDILYKTNDLNDVELSEEYCHIFNSPSTPPDIILVIEKKTNNYLKIFNSHIREVINSDYFTIDGIKNFILGTQEFKNYWEL
jgi:hypothetical protein